LPNEVNFSDSAVLKQKGVLGLVQDELLWGAIWLHEATKEVSYLEYVANNAEQMGGTGWTMNQFSWENKYVGVQIKATKVCKIPNFPKTYAKPKFSEINTKCNFPNINKTLIKLISCCFICKNYIITEFLSEIQIQIIIQWSDCLGMQCSCF
jgi:hypothetical protein